MVFTWILRSKIFLNNFCRQLIFQIKMGLNGYVKYVNAFTRHVDLKLSHVVIV